MNQIETEMRTTKLYNKNFKGACLLGRHAVPFTIHVIRVRFYRSNCMYLVCMRDTLKSQSEGYLLASE